jgi:hypothetical protein
MEKSRFFIISTAMHIIYGFESTISRITLGLLGYPNGCLKMFDKRSKNDPEFVEHGPTF